MGRRSNGYLYIVVESGIQEWRLTRNDKTRETKLSSRTGNHTRLIRKQSAFRITLEIRLSAQILSPTNYRGCRVFLNMRLRENHIQALLGDSYHPCILGIIWRVANTTLSSPRAMTGVMILFKKTRELWLASEFKVLTVYNRLPLLQSPPCRDRPSNALVPWMRSMYILYCIWI